MRPEAISRDEMLSLFRNDLTASLARTESERIVEERPEHVNVPQTVEQ